MKGKYISGLALVMYTYSYYTRVFSIHIMRILLRQYNGIVTCTVYSVHCMCNYCTLYTGTDHVKSIDHKTFILCPIIFKTKNI